MSSWAPFIPVPNQDYRLDATDYGFQQQCQVEHRLIWCPTKITVWTPQITDSNNNVKLGTNA